MSHSDNRLGAQLCDGVLPVTPCPHTLLQANSARYAEGRVVRTQFYYVNWLVFEVE